MLTILRASLPAAGRPTWLEAGVTQIADFMDRHYVGIILSLIARIAHKCKISEIIDTLF